MRRPISANFDDPKSPAFVACRSDLASYKLLAEPMFPVVEESLTQLAAGPPTINVALASLEQLWLGRTRIYAPSVGVTVLDPSVFAFILTAATDECRINGELAQASRVYMPGAQHGFYIRGGRRESIGVAVPRSPLVETVAALQGVDADDVVLDARSFEVRPRDTAHLRRAVDRTFESTSARTNGDLSEESARTTSSEILGWLLDGLLHSQGPTPKRGRGPERIVRKAEERFFDAGEHGISLADLCAAANVSQASLYRAFREVCGETPLGYFRKRRMSKARGMLLHASRERGAVKRAALSAGLTELGRFSVEYRQLFGESPSATLSDAAFE
jgi:AraC-like DNA-binding protein